MSGLMEITNDLFDIACRLKSVNENYRLYFNKVTDRYEVHDISAKPYTLAFVVPYDELDARTVRYARFTRVQNAEKVLQEIEENNAKVEKEAQKQAVDRFLSGLEGL